MGRTHPTQQPTFLHVHYFDPLSIHPTKGHTVTPAIVPSDQLVPGIASRKWEAATESMALMVRPFATSTYILTDTTVSFTWWMGPSTACWTAWPNTVSWDPKTGSVTADHGEAFWEHDDYGHSHTLWAETPACPWWSGITTAPELSKRPPDSRLCTASAPPMRVHHPSRARRASRQSTSAGVPWVAVTTKTNAGCRMERAWTTSPITDPHDRACSRWHYTRA